VRNVPTVLCGDYGAVRGGGKRGGVRVADRWPLGIPRLLIGKEQFRIVLKTTYDEELAEFAPGRLLLRDMLQKLAEGPMARRLEFYSRATADQLASATEKRPIFRATLFRWSALRQVAHVVKGIRHRFRCSDRDRPFQDCSEA